MRARGLTVLGGVTFAAVLAALYMALIDAPPERFMGDLQRLMYFHVGSAWAAMLAFFMVFVYGAAYLFTRRSAFDRAALASAEVGVFFTTLVLITGPIWARPVWNAWWTWDPRLTTTLILWFIYVAYLLLRGSIADDARRRVAASIFGIVGFLDVPIVHFSVTWWRSIHPNLISGGTINMDPAMTRALMVNGVAFVLLYALLTWLRTRLEAAREEAAQLRHRVYERIADRPDERERAGRNSESDIS
ncbi:MAG: cytochrome c biogenesis protein CcsA [Kyrpidia sp.]|nr:cytochrome c biogenesis protein CcsA [Kyrpidia sp.]